MPSNDVYSCGEGEWITEEGSFAVALGERIPIEWVALFNEELIALE